MKSKAVGFKLFSVMVPILLGPVLANGGALRLSGQVVNTGCNVQLLGQGLGPFGAQLIQVSTHVRLAVLTDNNACGGAIVPFQAVYNAVPRARVTIGTDLVVDQRSNGIVTLTYQ